MNNHQLLINTKIINFNLIIKICLIIGVWLLITPSAVQAQAISLSITPPLLEITIKPGKEYRQVYGIINSGSDVVLTPKILYFTPSDDFGNVDITTVEAPEWIKYNKEKFSLKSGSRRDFYILIDVPEDAQETDHYLSLVFESEAPTNTTNQIGTQYQTQIASNILLTISKDGNPKKSAEIINFDTPQISDSFLFPITYSITLANTGNSFWKPIGKIIANDQTLKLAEQNVISGHKRQIKCVENEELVDCKLSKKPILGVLSSTLEFSIDDDPKIYTKEVKTYILPITPAFFIILILTLMRQKFIFKLWRRKK